MEEGKININNGKLIYLNDKNRDKHAYFKTNSFEINLEDIAIIGVYYTLILDDEMSFLVFVNKKEEKFLIPLLTDLTTESLINFLQFFKLKNDFLSVDWNEYEKKNSYVLYPKNLRGIELYKKKNFLQSFFSMILKTFKCKQIAEGNLTDEISNYIANGIVPAAPSLPT